MSTLGDFVTLTRGTTYQSRLLNLGGPVLLGLASIAPNGGFRRASLKTYGGDSPERITLGPGDIYVSLKDVTQSGDLLGAVARVPTDVPVGRLTQDTVKLVLKPGVSGDFLYWLLRTPQYRDFCRAHATGTTNLGLPREDFLSFPVPKASKEGQLLVDLLGALDDKIELNRRMNETLAAAVALLYASQFEGADRAERELGDIVEVIDCLHSKKPQRQATGLPLLQLNNIRDDGLIDLNDVYAITESDYALWTSRMEAREGDCVITNVGRVGAAAQIPPGVTAALGRNMTGVRCKAEYPYPTFVLEALLSRGMRAEIERRTDAGTILSALNVRNIPKLRLPSASHDVLRGFEERARPLRARMELNLAESRTLAELRDALLPKLISGELRVRDAEEAVESAGA